jgi:predicted  nucleic acid-binding Zn-ribbon protein
MQNYAVLHVSKGKGPSEGLTAHNERTNTPENANPNLSHLNRIEDYTGIGRTLEERAKFVIAEAGVSRKVQDDAVRYCPILLSGSNEQMKRIQEAGKLDEWMQDNRRFIESRFGKENIISFAMHADESTPHIHVSVVPIIKDTNKKGKEVARLSAKDKFNPKALKALQDDYSNAMSKWGLKRGMDSQITRAKHTDTKQFYRDLPELIEQKKQEIENLQKELEGYSKLKGAKDVVGGIVSKLTQKSKFDALNDQILALNEKAGKLTAENEKLKEQLSNTNKAAYFFKDKLENLESKFGNIEEKIKSERYMAGIEMTNRINKFLRSKGQKTVDVRGTHMYLEGELPGHGLSR